MPTQRRLTGADATPSLKGPHGHRQCRWCRAEVFPPRTTFCSDECVVEHRLRSDPSFLRGQVYLRDKGICADCGLDTTALRVKMHALDDAGRERVGALHGVDAYHARKLMLWEADHVVAVKDGGGLTGLGNFATRCVRCHRVKTDRDR